MPVPICLRKNSERGLILQGIKCQSAPASHVWRIKSHFGILINFPSQYIHVYIIVRYDCYKLTRSDKYVLHRNICLPTHCLRATIYIYIYIYEDHKISFQTFFVWALLLIVHTWNSKPLRSNLLRLQCTCTVPTTSGRLHGSPLVWACQWPSSKHLSSAKLSHNDSLWAKGICKSHREQGLDYMEAEELSWCPSWSNSLWQGWSCGLMHCPGGNATDPIWRVLASSQGISSWTPLKPQHSNPNPNPLANQLRCIDFLTPPTPLIIPDRLPAFLESLMPH